MSFDVMFERVMLGGISIFLGCLGVSTLIGTVCGWWCFFKVMRGGFRNDNKRQEPQPQQSNPAKNTIICRTPYAGQFPELDSGEYDIRTIQKVCRR